MKTLVIYYSLSGNTRALAESIASACSADVLEIKDKGQSTGVFGYLRRGRNALLKRNSDIQPVAVKASDYDLVILGTPVWAYSVCGPMRTYLATNSTYFKQVAFFCTEGASGGERAFKQMTELSGKTPAATLEVTEADLKNGGVQTKRAVFIEELSRSHENGAVTVPDYAA